jgi:PncC family amidohydrolase
MSAAGAMPAPIENELISSPSCCIFVAISVSHARQADYTDRPFRLNDANLDPLASLASEVLARLDEDGMTLATAESITGGLVGHLLTETAGSSRVYLGGVVAYDNRLKERIGVPAQTLAEHGAVSEETAIAMATGIREWTGADLGLATTGIAGPTGATDTKPIGLSFVAVADARGAVFQRCEWLGDRTENKLSTAEEALRLIVKRLAESSK